MRRTKALRTVAATLMANPDNRFYGYDLSRTIGIRSGVIYPLLARLLDWGWITDGWDNPIGSRPPRRYYTITDTGRRAMAELLEEITL